MEATLVSATSTCRSAVLFIVFNRPDVTATIFASIRAARPPRLYVAADGPRSNRPGEAALCDQTRRIVEKVDWPCELKTLYQPRNLGCKEAVVAAIDWFFENEEEGTILEDDCLPSPDFFRFCDTLLEHYRHDTRVRHIGGANLQHGTKYGDSSYYFSRLTHIWGWASWRRVWRNYDKNLSRYTAEQIETAILDCFHEPLIAAKWKEIAVALQANKIDTWDYQLAIYGLLSGSVSIIPNVNLISNIGFGAGATHTVDLTSKNAGLQLGSLESIIKHPQHFVPAMTADLYTVNADFGIAAAKRRKAKHDSVRYRLKRWIAERVGPAKT
jgi:hypothetical protein